MQDIPLDRDGQPPQFLNNERRRERSVDELLGFLRAFLVDGPLTETKVLALAHMIIERAEELDLAIFGELASIITESIDDNGHVHPNALAKIDDHVRKILGCSRDDIFTRRTTKLPLTDPVPDVFVPGRVFCFTGKFTFGPRKRLEEAVIERGGHVLPHPTTETDYLVLGALASRDWAHTAYGRKIETAMRLRESYPIAIISEETFLCAIGVKSAPAPTPVPVRAVRREQAIPSKPQAPLQDIGPAPSPNVMRIEFSDADLPIRIVPDEPKQKKRGLFQRIFGS
jgi:hypothetical protein